jgi:holliday junction DNA helicase RuvA
MIATLRGKITDKSIDTLVLEAGGVGYELYLTSEDMGAILLGEERMVYVYEHIREQAHDLFGFVTRDTKELFIQLLGVTGIGPKMALSVLGIGSASEVRGAIAGGNVAAIQKANGVGKRIAERVVVELKDKVGLAGVDLSSTGILQSEVPIERDEATEALISLGYSPHDAAIALQKVDPSLPLEQRITAVLRG